jgi:ABC-2 type transport system permease protein
VIALLRTEFVKATRRTRTWVVIAALVGLPTLIVYAINRRGDRVDRGEGPGLFRLASQSGLLVPAAVLSVMSGFLLVIIAGIIAGDSVASDSSWGNLRYLLMRPVSRIRLLIAKATVAYLLIWLTTILVALAALVAGIIAFGSHDVFVPNFGGFGGSDPLGFTLTTSTLIGRTFIATAYVAFGYTALLAMGTFFSTLTDTVSSAVGATIGVYIISEILDAIPQLGTVRYAFPTHYLASWEPMFRDNVYPHDMVVGVIVQLVYLVVFGTAALVYFQRKDIKS